MKLRLFACIALAMVVAGAMALSSRMALAQGGRGGQGQPSEQDRGESGGQSADIDKALQAYEERMDRNLDKCRQELDQMKKELHELIDLRISMAMSLAELRARNPMPGMAFGGLGTPTASYRQAREGGRGAQARGEGHADRSGLARELQQVHDQLRSEIDQQQNQIAQLASQLRGMKEHGQHPGPGHQAQQRQGEQGRDRAKGQQVQGGGQGREKQ